MCANNVFANPKICNDLNCCFALKYVINQKQTNNNTYNVIVNENTSI